jgi:LPXTG-motif cell wall-anchored protein
VTVTEVKSGTVRHASGNTIIVQTDEGFKQFTQADVDKRGVKIYRAGKPADISSFREGDRLSATIVSHLPPSVVTQQQVDATLAQAPSRAPAATTAAASGTASATGASATGGTARTLPKTGSVQPLIGLVGLASLSVAWGLAALRRRRER